MTTTAPTPAETASSALPPSESRPRRLADNPALDTPASTAISCLLMEDTVDGGFLSVSGAPNTIALFCYPPVGKQEALVINESGLLTYLRRKPIGTGWAQEPVYLGGTTPIAASEVVAFVHHVDQSTWALYSPKEGGPPVAIQLVTPASGGVSMRFWQLKKDVIRTQGWNKIRRLSVSYCGRIPVVTGVDEKTFHGYSLHATVDTPDGKGGVARFADKRGPLLGGAVPKDLLGMTADVNGPTTFFALWPTSDLIRYDGGSDTHLLSDRAKALVGTYRLAGTTGPGVLYLEDTSRDRRELVACTSGPSGPLTTKTPGLHYTDASSWTDVDGMVHVYGVDDANVLKVVHQASWDSYARPVWTRSTVHNTQPPRSVVACLPLEPNIGQFVLDDYPDASPSLLWQRQGATVASDQFGIDTQDLTSALWTRERIRPPKGDTHKVTHYVSTVTVLDQRGRALPNLPVTVTADIQGEVRIDNASYLVGPEHKVSVKTNGLGKVVIASPADSLMPPTLHVDVVGMQNGAHIQPAAGVHDYLAGTGVLGSQKGTFTGPKLHESGIATGNRRECEDAAKSCHDAFGIANGKKIFSSVLTTADGAPAELHGFSLGRSFTPDAASGVHEVTRTEFLSPEALERHLEQIREQANYGGIWDDFKKWAGDVWEGIRRGVIGIEHAILDAVNATVHLFVKIGEEVIEAGKLIIDGLISAVHAVEAVIRQVVAAIVKVIDWLKALFDFQDIWDTKMALEAGLKTSVKQADAVAAYCGKQLKGWFPKQKKAVHDCFRDLERNYYHEPVGNGKNKMPTLHDHNQRPTDGPAIAGNPQATWMLDRAHSGPVMAAAATAFTHLDPAALEPVVTAWNRFIKAVENSKIVAEFDKTIGDFGAFLKRVMDPTDPDQADKSILAAFFTVLEDLIDFVLDALEGLVEALVALVSAAVAGFQELMGWKLDLGPLNALYKRIQPGDGPKEELTLGGLVCLIGAFAVTVAYKLIHGVDNPPFPHGFPVIPPPVFGALAGVRPQMAAIDMAAVKIAGGVLNYVAAPFAGIADIAPVFGGTDKFEPWFMISVASVNFLLNATYANVILAFPPLNGKEWDWNPATGACAFGIANWACAFVALFGFMFPGLRTVFDAPAFKNIGKVLIGPPMTTVFGIGKLVCQVLDKPKTEMAKMVIGFNAIPSFVQVFRTGANEPADFERAIGVAVVDILGNAIGGLMTVLGTTHP